MSLIKTAFASIDSKRSELVAEMPELAQKVLRAHATTGQGGATLTDYISRCETQLAILADHISDRRKWVVAHAVLPGLFAAKRWNAVAISNMLILRAACHDQIAALLSSAGVAGAMQQGAIESLFETASMKVAVRLENNLASINEEARSAVKKAGWSLFKKYAYPVFLYGIGFATAHYWPNLAPLLKLLKGQ